MAIGINLGDDEDRARRAIEDAEFAAPEKLSVEQQLQDTEHGVAAMTGAILYEALKHLLVQGEGLVLDLGQCVDDLKYVQGSQWIYVFKRGDVVDMVDMKPQDKLQHGARLRSIGVPGKMQRFA